MLKTHLYQTGVVCYEDELFDGSTAAVSDVSTSFTEAVQQIISTLIIHNNYVTTTILDVST